jgi:hypothetical protein
MAAEEKRKKSLRRKKGKRAGRATPPYLWMVKSARRAAKP